LKYNSNTYHKTTYFQRETVARPSNFDAYEPVSGTKKTAGTKNTRERNPKRLENVSIKNKPCGSTKKLRCCRVRRNRLCKKANKRAL